MNNYTFSTLSDEEFEEITRELLSEHLNIDFRTYRKGKDGGVDLSNGLSYDKNKIIGQVKHYPKSKFSDLRNSLKKEAIKMKVLSPERYILITSLDLSKGECSEIINILTPFLKTEDDIFDLKKLNYILQKKDNEWIEKKYYKLWLSSTNVLERIYNNGIYNNISWYIEDIKNKMPVYVFTSKYYEALLKLYKNRILLIHGEPGIGKTVLAEILAYHFLDKEFKLKYVSGNKIADIENIISPNPEDKEVIFMDDFLGSNFLELLNKFEESKLSFFIRKNLSEKNKYIILTTRTSIYNKGKITFEGFKNISKDFEEISITLSDYNSLEKAKILYNHLFFKLNNVEYFNDIKKSKNYLKIISHKNYFPRIIEFVTNENNISEILPEQYYKFIIEALDNPSEIWDYEFNKKIDELGRILIIIIYSFNSEMPKEKIEIAFYQRLKYEKKVCNDFEEVLKIIDKAFINIVYKYNRYNIDFSNPSIKDYLFKYLSKNNFERIRIIETFKYFEQLKMFRLKNENYQFTLTEMEVLKQRILKDYSSILSINENIVVSKNLGLLNLYYYGLKNDMEIEFFILNLYINILKDKKAMLYEEVETLLRILLNSIYLIKSEYNCFELWKNIKYEIKSINQLKNLKIFLNGFSKNLKEEILNDQDIFIEVCSKILSFESQNEDTRFIEEYNGEETEISKKINEFYHELKIKYISEILDILELPNDERKLIEDLMIQDIEIYYDEDYIVSTIEENNSKAYYESMAEDMYIEQHREESSEINDPIENMFEKESIGF